MKCIDNFTSAFHPWACEGAFEKIRGDECISSAAPYEYKSGYIEVTPYIESLADQIDIEDCSSAECFFNRILHFTGKEHEAFANYGQLKQLAQSSMYPKAILSIEETDELILRAINGVLTDEDRFLTSYMLDNVSRIFSAAETHYYENHEEYEEIIRRMEEIDGYYPLMKIYPEGFIEIRETLPDKSLLHKADHYLRYRMRIEVLSSMLSEEMLPERIEILENAIGHGLTPNAWTMFPGDNFTPEARVDNAFRLYEKNWDYPFSLTADELLRYKIATGCSHAAIMFMSLARALGYDDVRIVTAIFNRSYNEKYCSGGKDSKPDINRYIDSHKVVMVHIDGRYHLINTTNPELEIISSTYDGEPIDPATLIGKDVLIPSLIGVDDETGPMLRVRAIGENSGDYLNNDTAEQDVNILMTGKHDGTDHNCNEYPLPNFTI